MQHKLISSIKFWCLLCIVTCLLYNILSAQTYLEKKEYKQIIKIYKQKKYKRAYKRFKGFLDKYPSGYYLPDALFYLGVLERNYYSAIIIYKKLIAEFPEYEKTDEALYRLGKLYLLHNNYSEAIRTFENLLEKYKKSNYIYGSHYYLGLIYLMKHDKDDALKYYNWVLGKKKKDKFYKLSFIGKANVYHEDRDYKKSIFFFKEVVKLKDKNYFPSAYYGLGNNYYKLKKYEKSYYYLKKVIKEFPGSSEYEMAMEKLKFIKENKTIFDQINWDKFKAEEKPKQLRPKKEYFTVQVASVKNKRYANDWRIKLKTAGYDSYSKTVRTDKGRFYRTCVGRYNTKNEAEKIQKKIEYDFKLKGTILHIKE